MKDSYVVNSYIKPRKGEEALFTDKGNGEVTAALNGYAVIPIEEYKGLTEGDLVDQSKITTFFENLKKLGISKAIKFN